MRNTGGQKERKMLDNHFTWINKRKKRKGKKINAYLKKNQEGGRYGGSCLNA